MVNRPQLSPENNKVDGKQIWVVFSNDTDIGVLKLLRHGFRHCFALMQQDGRWIIVDPRSNQTDVQLLSHPRDFNFPRYFMEQGKTVLKIDRMDAPASILSPFPVSCVDTIKRIIGLHAWWVITPHQLYRTLLKRKRGR